MRKNKMTGRAKSLPVGAFQGALYGFAWTLLAAAVLAWLIQKEVIREEGIGYGSMVILLTSSALGARIGCSKVRRQKLLTCLCSGGMYFLLLLSMTALFFGGQYTGIGVTVLLVMGGCAAAWLLEMEFENRKGSGRKIRV